MKDNLAPILLSKDIRKFLEDFLGTSQRNGQNAEDNDTKINSALVYEKIRVALEYQEEHLVFKNAIARIMRRKLTLTSLTDIDQIYSDLISELSWANYINPENISDEDTSKIKGIMNRYIVFLRCLRSGRFKKHELIKMTADWMACEINEVFYPSTKDQIFLEYVFSILNKNVTIEGAKISEEEHQIQLRMAIYGLLFKPDFAQIQYWTLRKVYPEWLTLGDEEIKKISRSFDPFYNKIDRQLNHNLKKRYIQFAKRYVAPFIVMKAVLSSKFLTLEKFEKNPTLLHTLMMETYASMVETGRKKVWGGTFRALIFILLTKISLAFILEVPFDRYFVGSVNLFSLAVNISLPPFLMLVAGTFVKSPSRKNEKILSETAMNMITKDEVGDRVFSIAPKKALRSYVVFNLFYSIISLVILAGVVRLLVFLDFNFLSIILFFFFVSVVSFFSFRIRNIALELAMKRSKDDALTSTLEFFFLPFIRIGKYFSDQFTHFNPFILALDFLIETPFKTIIKIMNSWLRFVNAKKEDLEF